MISEIEFAQGDIVAVPFPYTDRQTEKRRPALVISNGKVSRDHGLVWLAMITSADNQCWENDIAVEGKSTGLSSPSVIRVAKLATIDASLIIRVAGKIDDETRSKVFSALQDNLK